MADLGSNARAVKGSVSDLADLDRLYAAVKAERGTLDIVVFANAGVGSQLALGKITAEHIDETFAPCSTSFSPYGGYGIKFRSLPGLSAGMGDAASDIGTSVRYRLIRSAASI